MTLQSDNEFETELRRYLTERDIEKIFYHASLPEQNANINKRTGRAIIGASATKPRRILLKSSLKNYKSIILKFAKFKAENSGPESAITENIAQSYNTKIMSDDKMKYQTVLTNVRVLNRYVIVPILGMELGKPRVVEELLINNKPQFTSDEIIKALRYVWENCKNKDHAYKMILIYYTGLRSKEVDDLTYRDVLNAIGTEHIILRVRRGKGNCKRNIYIFQGAPSDYFRLYLLPYLETKIMLKLTNNDYSYENISQYLDDKLFSDSSYQAAQKEFKRALKWAVGGVMYVKGAGLHSIRSDYSTRMLELIGKNCKNARVAIKIVGRLMGHNKEYNIEKHYINLGFKFSPSDDDDNNNVNIIQSDNEDILENNDNNKENILQQLVKEQNNNNNNVKKEMGNKNIFKNFPCGNTVKETLKKEAGSVRNHASVGCVINMTDDNYLI